LADKLPTPEWQVTIRQTNADDDMTQLARAAVEDGNELVCAAGGDGTVSHVVDALVGTEVQLGIIPAGTTNALAQGVGIPRQIEGAIQVIANPGRCLHLDAMQIDNSYYVLGVGVGLSAVTMEKTTRENKRRFGEAAYVWTVLKQLSGWQPRHFSLTIDGKQETVSAADVLLANAGVLTGSLKWGEHILPDDGRIDLCVIRARSLSDYLGLLMDVVRRRQWRNRHIQFFVVEDRVKISAGGRLAVTGDGEIIGHTPFEARVVPAAVTVRAP
jgi:YegS/Rv2252/BmrU family lipid kinase